MNSSKTLRTTYAKMLLNLMSQPISSLRRHFQPAGKFRTGARDQTTIRRRNRADNYSSLLLDITRRSHSVASCLRSVARGVFETTYIEPLQLGASFSKTASLPKRVVSIALSRIEPHISPQPLSISADLSIDTRPALFLGHRVTLLTPPTKPCPAFFLLDSSFHLLRNLYILSINVLYNQLSDNSPQLNPSWLSKPILT